MAAATSEPGHRVWVGTYTENADAASDPGDGVFLLPGVGGGPARGFRCGASPSFLASWQGADDCRYLLVVNELPQPRGRIRAFRVDGGQKSDLVEAGPRSRPLLRYHSCPMAIRIHPN